MCNDIESGMFVTDENTSIEIDNTHFHQSVANYHEKLESELQLEKQSSQHNRRRTKTADRPLKSILWMGDWIEAALLLMHWPGVKGLDVPWHRPRRLCLSQPEESGMGGNPPNHRQDIFPCL